LCFPEVQTLYAMGGGALTIFTFDGIWSSADSISVDLSNKLITADFSGGVSYLAVAFRDSGLDPVALMPGVNTTAGLSPSAEIVPEPCGTILLTIGIGLARRRRRSSAVPAAS
jgi:hypothetical protein